MAAAKRSPWGWHCLTDDWATHVVASAGALQGKLVLDIGAGTGSLTGPLVAAGAKVIAIELHPERAAILRSRFERHNVTVVRADAADLRLPRRPFIVVANPPFAITTPLLNRLLHPGSRLEQAHVVLQLDAARKWANGNMRGVGKWLGCYDVRIGQRLPRKAFQPPPRVDVAVLTINRVR